MIFRPPSTTNVERRHFSKRLMGWWSDPSNQRHFLWRSKSTIYELLIAELLLRRTNASAAQSVYVEFLQNYPTPDAFANAQPKNIQKLVHKLGLHWRALNLVALAKHLRIYGSVLPRDLDKLAALPGVGPYVSRAVLVNNMALNVVPVDTNVVRVLCRIFGIDQSDSLRRNKQFQSFADSMINEVSPSQFNFALLDFAAAICRSRSPRCSTCPFSSRCDFYLNQLAC